MKTETQIRLLKGLLRQVLTPAQKRGVQRLILLLTVAPYAPHVQENARALLVQFRGDMRKAMVRSNSQADMS